MPVNDLLVLLDREIERLSAENDHSASVLMREAARVIRELHVRVEDAELEAAGLRAEANGQAL